MNYAIIFAIVLFGSLQFAVPALSSTAVAGVQTSVDKRAQMIEELSK